MSIDPIKVEILIDNLLEHLPEKISLADSRDLFCQLLFRLNVHTDDLPFFLLLVVDAYMGNRMIDKTD